MQTARYSPVRRLIHCANTNFTFSVTLKLRLPGIFPTTLLYFFWLPKTEEIEKNKGTLKKKRELSANLYNKASGNTQKTGVCLSNARKTRVQWSTVTVLADETLIWHHFHLHQFLFQIGEFQSHTLPLYRSIMVTTSLRTLFLKAL